MNKLWPGASKEQRGLLRKQYRVEQATDAEILELLHKCPEHFARPEEPPFGRGETFYGLNPVPAIDPNNLGGKQHEGKTWVFEDVLWNNLPGVTGARKTRTNRYVTCMVVRNVAGFNLLPKRLVTLKQAMTAAYEFFGQVDGYAAVTAAANAFGTDEFLPAAGVPNNDLFWVVTEGPHLLLSDAANGSITQFGRVGAMTASSSGTSLAGRIADLSAATLATQLLNAVGVACTGGTTANTSADILVDRRWW